MDTVIDSLPSSEQAGMDVYQYNKLLSDIQNTIQNSSAIDSIARKYTDALTKGLRDGKTFNEIDIDIDDELTALSSVTYNSIKDYTDNTYSTITLSLFADTESAKKAINNYASCIYADIQYRAAGLAGIYQTNFIWHILYRDDCIACIITYIVNNILFTIVSKQNLSSCIIRHICRT